ncbi:MAG: polysaccharide biosynthesis protein [Pseudomonadota bacterium]
MEEVLKLVGRSKPLFEQDLAAHEADLKRLVASSRILVVGGGGSIGRAVAKQLFALNPKVLHVVDISENNLVELVRDIRSSLGHVAGEFKTYCLDCGSREFEALMESQDSYDYVLNFSALKHVRSEKDPYTLMRMIQVNIVSGEKLLSYAIKGAASKYFSVSTDKASDPVNMMGASKRIMELLMMRASAKIPVSTARFANVAFSDGSLLDGFNYRLRKRQPFSAPSDVKRYFITEDEAGALCLLSSFVGLNRELFFPKLKAEDNLTSFSDIAEKYLIERGYTPYVCASEDEARQMMKEPLKQGIWPCYFFTSDTTGEKEVEEFYSANEQPIWDKFADIGVITIDDVDNGEQLDKFLYAIEQLRHNKKWSKADLVKCFNDVLSNFAHKETFKYLDDRM